MEAYQLQSPSSRVGPQVLPEIEMPFKVKYERKRVHCGGINSYERHDVSV